MAFAHPPFWGRIAGYRMGEEQSAGVPAISQLVVQPFCHVFFSAILGGREPRRDHWHETTLTADAILSWTATVQSHTAWAACTSAGAFGEGRHETTYDDRRRGRIWFAYILLVLGGRGRD